MTTATLENPVEGCTRCACGAKYWDLINQSWICASCKEPWDGQDHTDDLPYEPAHPVSLSVIVKLSNGKEVEVEITERESSEKGDFWAGITASGVLVGHVVRTAQHELRDARERAEAYGR